MKRIYSNKAMIFLLLVSHNPLFGFKNQKQYYSNIINLNPKRIIFNPGAENEELSIMARQKALK